MSGKPIFQVYVQCVFYSKKHVIFAVKSKSYHSLIVHSSFGHCSIRTIQKLIRIITEKMSLQP